LNSVMHDIEREIENNNTDEFLHSYEDLTFDTNTSENYSEMMNLDLNSDMHIIAKETDNNNTNDFLLVYEDLAFETNSSENHSEDDISSKMDHLMHSDTMILVAGLVVMIFVGLASRSICVRLTSKNQRKKLMRGGLKEMARHMDHVTRAMSNDLELPDSPKTVIRTYSNYGGKGQSATNVSEKTAPTRNSLRVQAFTNSLRHESENREIDTSGPNFSIEMRNINKEER